MPDIGTVLDNLVTARGAALKRYAFLLCGDRDRADDLVQEALVRAIARSARPDVADLERYVRRILLNLVVDESRRARRWLARLPRLAARGESADAAELVAERLDLAGVLAALPPRQRACLVLHHYEDLPVAEVAALLGCSPGTVKSQLHDARRAVARAWRAREQEYSGQGRDW